MLNDKLVGYMGRKVSGKHGNSFSAISEANSLLINNENRVVPKVAHKPHFQTVCGLRSVSLSG